MKFHNGGHDTGYNIQFGSDPVNKFISSDYVSDSANDTQQLRENINVFKEEHGQCLNEANVDSGYFNYDEIQAIEKEEAITIFSPAPKTKSDKIKFEYDAENDRYICQEGKYLTLSHKNKKTAKKNKKSIQSIYSVYVCKDCADCPLKSKCTKSKTGRHISRYWNQEYRDKRKEFSKSPLMKEQMLIRKSTCEHIFGTMKRWLGYVPLLRQGKEKVTTDIQLFVSAYNILRFINLIDFGKANAMLDMALSALNMPKKAIVFFVKILKAILKRILAISYMFQPSVMQFSHY